MNPVFICLAVAYCVVAFVLACVSFKILMEDLRDATYKRDAWLAVREFPIHLFLSLVWPCSLVIFGAQSLGEWYRSLK